MFVWNLILQPTEPVGEGSINKTFHMIISKKNRKHNEVSSNRAELEIVYPRYVVRQPNRLSNCKSIDLLSYRPHDEKTKDSMHLPLSIEKDGVVRGPSQSHRKQSKTKRKSIKMNNGRETPRPHRNISDSKLVTICNRYLNQDRSRSGASQSMKSMDMLRHIY